MPMKETYQSKSPLRTMLTFALSVIIAITVTTSSTAQDHRDPWEQPPYTLSQEGVKESSTSPPSRKPEKSSDQKPRKSVKPGKKPKTVHATLPTVPPSTNELYPRLDGDDVLVPQFLIENIERNDNNISYVFDPKKPVYSAYDFNGWLILGKSAKSKLKHSEITKEGQFWRARNLKNKRFHPVQVINTTLENPYTEPNIAWAKIEHYGAGYSSLPFVDISEGSPCLCLGEKCPKNLK